MALVGLIQGAVRQYQSHGSLLFHGVRSEPLQGSRPRKWTIMHMPYTNDFTPTDVQVGVYLDIRRCKKR